MLSGKNIPKSLGQSWAFFCLHTFSGSPSFPFYCFTVSRETVEDTAAVQTWLCCWRSHYLTRQKSINTWLFMLESRELLTGCNFITLWALKPLIQTRAAYMKHSDTCASLNSDGVHQREINSKALFLDLSFILGVMERAKLCDLWPINSKAQMRCSWNGCDMWYIRRGLFSTEFLFNAALPHWQKVFPWADWRGGQSGWSFPGSWPLESLSALLYQLSDT